MHPKATYKMHPKLAIPRHDVLQVSMARSSNFENCLDFHQSYRAFNGNKQYISFKVVSYSACYLTNGDYITYLLEKLTRENKVIVVVKKR